MKHKTTMPYSQNWRYECPNMNDNKNSSLLQIDSNVKQDNSECQSTAYLDINVKLLLLEIEINKSKHFFFSSHQ